MVLFFLFFIPSYFHFFPFLFLHLSCLLFPSFLSFISSHICPSFPPSFSHSFFPFFPCDFFCSFFPFPALPFFNILSFTFCLPSCLLPSCLFFLFFIWSFRSSTSFSSLSSVHLFPCLNFSLLPFCNILSLHSFNRSRLFALCCRLVTSGAEGRQRTSGNREERAREEETDWERKCKEDKEGDTETHTAREREVLKREAEKNSLQERGVTDSSPPRCVVR